MGRRGNGEGSLYYSKALGKWVGQIRTVRGTKTLTQRKTENKTDFIKRFQYNVALINQGTYIDKNNVTFSNVIENYIDNKFETNQISERTYKRNKDTLNQVKKVCSDIANMPIQKITIYDIKRVLPNLTTYSNNTIEKIYGMMNKAFKIAVAERIIQFNPMDSESINKPKSIKQDKKIQALTIEEQKNLIEALKIERMRNKSNWTIREYINIILLQLSTGMRIGEVCALTVDCINFEEGTIKVYRTLTRDKTDKVVMGKTTKTESGGRKFYMIKIAKELCDRILSETRVNSEYLLFYDYNKHSYITPSQVNCYLKRINKKYNIAPNLHTHMLRHTYATRFIEAGGSPKVLQKNLGHKDIGITLNTYTSVLDQYSKEQIDKYSKYLEEQELN